MKYVVYNDDILNTANMFFQQNLIYGTLLNKNKIMWE